jgi:uncharacterized protein YegL
MSGNKLNQLKNAVKMFVDQAEKIGLGERIAIVEFGNHTRCIQGLTNNYTLVRNAAKSLTAGGTTPMAQGLLIALKEIADHGKITTINNSVRLFPRIIMMTDGEPDSKDEVKGCAALFAELKVAIACVGVTGCDKPLLELIARGTGGMFTMSDHVEGLSTFFVRQVMLSLFIAQFARDMARLYSLEQLRQFMYEQTGEMLNNAELEALLFLIQTMTQGSGAAPAPSPGAGPARRALPPPAPAQVRPRPAPARTKGSPGTQPQGNPVLGCGCLLVLLAAISGGLWALGKYALGWF